MASINDFKYVKLLSKNMYSYIPNITKSIEEDIEKERLGFYHLVLEKITGITDANSIQEIIQDKDYLSVTNGEIEDDLGIDAVYINKEQASEKEIMLFNFKYRSKFSPNKTTSENDVPISTKFFQYLVNNSSLPKNMNKNSNVYKNICQVRECLDSDDIYNITLYLVTNEANGFKQQNNELISRFEQNYGMTINTITLDDIVSFLSVRKDNVSAKLLLNIDDFITYSGDSKSSETSYMCKLPLIELIRITCDNDDLKLQYNIENDEQINSCRLQYSLLYDNVRGYLGQTAYNKNIYRTIKEDGKNFFLFNNGITITCSNVTSDAKNSNKKYLLTLTDFQIVNGGQTLRSIYNFLQNEVEQNKLEKLRDSFVLVRIFKIDSENEVKNRIAEYTNSQNAISPIDLKSVNKIQIDLEKYLKSQNVLYIRKAGDVGDVTFDYDYRISMEKFTQILYASQGYPDRVSNVKKRLFSNYYDDIYSPKNFVIEKAKELIELYFKIEKYYINKRVKSKYDQRIFYIVYIVNVFDKNIEEADDILNRALENYGSTLKETRVFLKPDFRNSIAEFV